MAKADGKGSRADKVTFTRPAAERIAKVVRQVEAGDRGSASLDYEHPGPLPFKLRVATFTGSWSAGSYKTVTLYGSTNTVSVYNWCNPVSDTEGTKYVVFGKFGGTHTVVEIQMRSTATCVMSFGGVDVTQLAGYDSTSIQLLGHNTTGPCLQWYSVTTCT